MNRFSVNEDCSLLFEERWSERKSQLPSQDGFVSFSLLRRRVKEYNKEQDEKLDDSFNYASCTIWASHGALMGWRNGDGRYSHVHPEDGKKKRRTSVS
jgi:heme-degrading monooxygenase HmoA